MATASESTPTAGRWFYAQNRQKIGPLSWQALKDQAAAGILRPSDMILRDGTGRWQRADSVEDLFAASVIAETVAEPPGPANAQSSSVSVTAAYLPAEPQTQSDGAQSAATPSMPSSSPVIEKTMRILSFSAFRVLCLVMIAAAPWEGMVLGRP